MISYTDYKIFGYTLIPKPEFRRHIMRAVQTAQRFTFDRLSPENLTEANKFGLCELAELFYKEVNNLKPVISATNDRYSETYGLRSLGSTMPTIDEDAYSIMLTYFTREQLYRGV